MYKWYTKERDLWIQVNSFEQKASPPPLPPIFPCFLQSFATLPLVHVQIWLNPASSAPISWSSGCCETCRELQLFSPQTLLTNNLTPSKMKSNLKIKKKKNLFFFHLFQVRMSWLYRLPIWTFPGDPQRLWRSPNSLQPSLYPLPLRDSSVKCAALVWRGSAWNLIFRNINVTMLKIDSNKCVNSACSDFTTVVLR